MCGINCCLVVNVPDCWYYDVREQYILPQLICGFVSVNEVNVWLYCGYMLVTSARFFKVRSYMGLLR